MQSGVSLRIKTDSALHFTGAIAQNAGEGEDIALAMEVAAGKHCRGRIKAIAIQSVEARAWEVWLWSKSTKGVTGNVDTSTLIGYWGFAAADGLLVTGDANYYYYIDGLDQSYWDEDISGQLHITLVNRSAAAKSADAAGAVAVRLFMDLAQGI